MKRHILGMTAELWPPDLPLPMYADGDLVPAPSWGDCAPKIKIRLKKALKKARAKLKADDRKRSKQ